MHIPGGTWGGGRTCGLFCFLVVLPGGDYALSYHWPLDLDGLNAADNKVICSCTTSNTEEIMHHISSWTRFGACQLWIRRACPVEETSGHWFCVGCNLSITLPFLCNVFRNAIMCVHAPTEHTQLWRLGRSVLVP